MGDALGVHGFAHIGDERRDVPWWLPSGGPVPAQVDRDDLPIGQVRLHEPAESAAVTHHAVNAQHGGRIRITPPVDVQPHGPNPPDRKPRLRERIAGW